MANIQPQLEKLIGKNYFLNLSAKEAYKAYVRAYDSHSLKQIFDISTLDLEAVAKSFGFQVPPFVDLPLTGGKSSKNSNRPISSRGTGRTNSYAPAGGFNNKKKSEKSIIYKAVPVKKGNDRRQFTR